jgi:alkanesulfonate monooxygenase SsuD/methylene tetrahydromethanopterin reductase-like flavin-dependent oxidoreductase (luciferase family)
MERKVKFSVRIHQGGYSYESLRRIWIQADRLGYYSATLYDLLNVPTLECWTALSALAAETERIRLTPLVLANLYRPPALLAKMVSTLDVISGGRFELGIGAGGDKNDHLASGYPFPPTSVRVEMLEEAVELIKKLWTEPEVNFEGRYYTPKGAAINPKPAQAPHPPVLIGGHGETYLLRAVARHADICNIGFEMSIDEHRAKLRFLEKHCQDVGRDPSKIEVTHNTRILIAENSLEFEKLAAHHAASSQMSLRDYKASLSKAIAGTPEQCAEQIQRYLDNGITYFFLLFPDPIQSECLELFAREVMPNFNSTSGNPK